MTTYLDLETYSETDLKKSNAYRYAEDPSFLILMAAWAVDDGPVTVYTDMEDIYSIPGLWAAVTEKVAHNAAFERICMSQALRDIDDNLAPDEYLDPAQWTDTQALAALHGYPQKLETLAQAIGAEDKDSAGTRLITLFCKPNREGRRNMPEEFPEEWEQFKAYCAQDVETLRDIHKRLPGWPNEAERQAYITDQHINDNGIKVDAAMATQAMETAVDNRWIQELEITNISGVDNPGSGPQMTAWLTSRGLTVPNLQADTVTELLADTSLPDDVRRVLDLKQELAMVAAKKYEAALARINKDSRLRGAFQFAGAHTGRWAGRGVQLQNLPSATLGQKGDSDADIDTAIASGVLDLALGTGVDANTLKALVRAMFVGPFTVVDYAAIEARVVSWLAGEQWALQAFRDGRDIYVETAERMGGLTRKEGKVAVLALGYNGGVNSLRIMGAQGEDYQLKKMVYQWRDANPNIVNLWAQMDEAFRSGDAWAGDLLYVERDGDDRRIVLPSGRAVTYHGVSQKWGMDNFQRRRLLVSFLNPAKHPQRAYTYGGKLTENITQAVARDILSEALVRLDTAGYKVVGHVHDEILVEGDVSIEEVKAVMVQPPTWSKGLPLAAEGFTCPRYRKG